MLLFRQRAVKTALLATRCGSPQTITGSFTKMNSRSAHIARDDIASLQLVLVNWHMNNVATETLPGAATTYTASIEYPAGIFTQVTFAAGSTSAVVADGDSVTSDSISVAIPNGAKFWVRLYVQNATGIIYQGFGDPTFGDGSEMSAGALSDKTMSGTITTGGSNILHPFAIIGPTRKPAVALFTDSLYGSNDTADGVTGDIGAISRWIGPNFAYCSLGASGGGTAGFVSSGTRRRTILPYCTHSIFAFGVNDIGSRTATQIESDYQSAWQLSRAQGVIPFQTTITPRPTASSDSWATAANQTIDATTQSRRSAVNTDLRAGSVIGVEDIFDVASFVEDQSVAGAYITNGVANYYTSDGIHGKSTAYTLIRDGLVDTARDIIQRAY